uniref:Phage major tail tube protein n=1 Tax=Candidatus Kentrum sp. LFY TaxID=2126342 RepID=A0A450WGS0_9GAMM|nr:MAG: hypothetical protein BECKLFY1418C_GA0070996_102228 [Candidatus Kentron sp. LFY]
METNLAITQVSNANIYLDGKSLLGRAEEVKLPDITVAMSERKSLGMVGVIELPTGFEKMEGEIKWNSLYKDVALGVANPWKAVSLQVRANQAGYASGGRIAQVPLVVHLTVSFKKNPLGTFKQNESAEFTSSFSCYYIKQVLGGEEILEFDAMANIYKVGGVDQLADFRKNTGA